jgi:hypothetical protein
MVLEAVYAFRDIRGFRELQDGLAGARHLYQRIAACAELDLRLASVRSYPGTWCTSRGFRFGWTRARLTTADSRAG